MVVDDASRNLYVAQEDIGIWRVPVPFGRGAPVLVDRTKGSGVPATYDEATEECVPSGPDPGFGGRHLTADVEGLEIVPRRGKAPLLVASSQGDNTFATYERDGTRYRRGFAVVDGAVDDGERLRRPGDHPVPLGARYPGGPAVVQDGDDTPAGESSNVTFVRWDTIARGLRL
jgi:3-phytase